MHPETLTWLRLYRSENVGPAIFFRLIERFGSAGAALDALAGRLKPCPAEPAQAELDALDRIGGEVLLAEDPRFPPALKILEIAPLLSVHGDASLLAKPSVALVGTREASINGRKLAFNLAAELGKAGYPIVSGLARGIDTAAHQGGLATGTVAVVAGGVDIIYPPENARLYQQIAETGCVVSEMPPGLHPTAQHFPRRNRLIAGIAQGVVVVEAKLRSGSLITARFALEQGRDIFAVPGSPLDPRSAGPNSLIKQGAILVECAGDILDGLGAPSLPEPPAPPTVSDDGPSLSAAHEMVEKSLTVTAVTVDEILRQCQLSPSTLSLVLLELELAGRLLRHPDHSISLRA